MSPLVDYLVARSELPPSSGVAFDYLLGGDGLFVAAENRCLRARVPVAPAVVRGLPPLYAAVELRRGRLPQALWDGILAEMTAHQDTEVLLAVVRDGAGYRLVRPTQVVRPLRVTYRPVPDAVLEVHSHRHLPARFSAIDDADEQGFRLYGVVGRLGSDHPEVALRVGVYGHFLHVPWDTVFAGVLDDVRDLTVQPACGLETDDELPD
jgi:PRTRC genetic system protein A